MVYWHYTVWNRTLANMDAPSCLGEIWMLPPGYWPNHPPPPSKSSTAVSKWLVHSPLAEVISIYSCKPPQTSGGRLLNKTICTCWHVWDCPRLNMTRHVTLSFIYIRLWWIPLEYIKHYINVLVQWVILYFVWWPTQWDHWAEM